jgi:hypothetical protein
VSSLAVNKAATNKFTSTDWMRFGLLMVLVIGADLLASALGIPVNRKLEVVASMIVFGAWICGNEALWSRISFWFLTGGVLAAHLVAYELFFYFYKTVTLSIGLMTVVTLVELLALGRLIAFMFKR